MKLYKIYSISTDWDCCAMCAVLAKNEEEARNLAVKYHTDLKDNIREVQEIPLDKAGIVASQIKWG